MAGRRKAKVFPVPVFACARISVRFSRRSWRVADCTYVLSVYEGTISFGSIAVYEICQGRKGFLTGII